jgi:hypothetical protein
MNPRSEPEGRLSTMQPLAPPDAVEDSSGHGGNGGGVSRCYGARSRRPRAHTMNATTTAIASPNQVIAYCM